MQSGVLLFGRYGPERMAALARLVDGLGYDYLWVADERFFRECYVELAWCAAHTRHVALGPCVTDPFSRHPALTAMAMAALDEVSGGRAALGMGAGASGFAEMGLSRAGSAEAIRAAVAMIRGLWRGERVTLRRGSLALEGAQLDFAPARADVPVFVAGQGPRTMRLAGEIAQGLITSSCVTEADVTRAVARLRDGAAAAGRSAEGLALVSRVNTCITTDRPAALAALKPMVLLRLKATCPDFRALEEVGLHVPDDLAERVGAAAYGPSLASLAAFVPEALVDGLCLAGPAEEVAERVRIMARAGVTQVAIYPVATPGQDEEHVIRAFAERVLARL